MLIVATLYYSDEVSSRLEGVTWELFLKLVDLTWNDPIHTGSETDTHAYCIPVHVAGRSDLSYIVNNGKTNFK